MIKIIKDLTKIEATISLGWGQSGRKEKSLTLKNFNLIPQNNIPLNFSLSASFALKSCNKNIEKHIHMQLSKIKSKTTSGLSKNVMIETSSTSWMSAFSSIERGLHKIYLQSITLFRLSLFCCVDNQTVIERIK